MIDYQRAYHLGIRVPDLDTAMDEMRARLGVTWCSVQSRSQSVWTPEGGLLTVPLRFTYSAEGPQHLELLEGAPGSVWHAGDAPGIHHTGVWVDDVKAEVAAAVADGRRVVASQASPEDGYGVFAYVQPPSGLIVELVWSAAEPRFQRWWAGGSLT